jgi:UDP-glucose 4-epimerase
MKVLVTGGLGYVGSACAKLMIEHEHDVLIVDDGRDSVAASGRRAADVFGQEMVLRRSIGKVEAATIRLFNPDLVMHFAGSASIGPGEKDPDSYLTNNVVEFQAFLRALSETTCRNIIFSGTAAVYGTQEAPVSETVPPRPDSWYAWSKLLAEQYLVWMAKVHEFRYVAFRYFNVAGAGYDIVERRKKEEHLIPLAFDALIEGNSFVVNGVDHPTSDGTCIRDFVHVLDVAEAHRRAAGELIEGRIDGEIINLGSGKGYSVLEVLKKVEEITGQKIDLKHGLHRDGDSISRIADVEKARRLLGWSPVLGLHEMIRDAWAAKT